MSPPVAARFRAEIVPPADAPARLAAAARAGTHTSFQRPDWLSDWYATFAPAGGPVEPLVVEIVEAGSGAVALTLPLAVDRRRFPHRIGFADGGVTDYGAPILGPAAPETAEGAADALAALRTVLPRAGLLCFEKMPPAVEGRVNPFTLVPGVFATGHVASVLPLPGTWEVYLKALPRHTRKEFGRTFRVFLRHEGAAFLRITDPDFAGEAMTALELMQRRRITELGLPYGLDEPAVAAFYRRHLASGLERGDVMLTALTAGDTIVAVLYGTFYRGTYTMLRIASLAGDYASASPGRTLVERTMHLVSGEGAQVIDFALGDYVYKRRFGAATVPLMTLAVPLGMGGLPHVLALRTRHHLVARHPRLVGVARRLLGRKPRPEPVAEDAAD